LFTHPSKSYLVFDGKLVKNADDAVYGDNDVTTLTNNAMMHIFNNIKYQLSGQEIESLFHPGQATTMVVEIFQMLGHVGATIFFQ